MRVLNNKNADLTAQKYHIRIIYEMIPVPIKAVTHTKWYHISDVNTYLLNKYKASI